MAKKRGKDKIIKLGVVDVDSGQLVIMDPCYIRKDMIDENAEIDYDNPKNLYDKCCKETTENHGGQLLYDTGAPGLGVAFTTGLGDGMYEVEAKVGEVKGCGERVKEIRIKFI